MNRVLSVCVMGGAVSVIALQEYKADLCIVKEGRQTHSTHIHHTHVLEAFCDIEHMTDFSFLIKFTVVAIVQQV